jgi:hypothetical protein
MGPQRRAILVVTPAAIQEEPWYADASWQYQRQPHGCVVRKLVKEESVYYQELLVYSKEHLMVGCNHTSRSPCHLDHTSTFCPYSKPS